MSDTAVTTEATVQTAVEGQPPVQVQAPVTQVQIQEPTTPTSKVDAAANEANESEASAPTVYEYTKTNDPGLDVALEFVGSRGIGPEDPAFKAAMQGDFSLLRAKLAGMGTQAQGYDEFVKLAEQAYKRSEDQANEQAKAATKAALGILGGQAEFDQAAAYIKANADPEEIKVLNKLLKGSPMEARAAAALMKMTFASASGVTKPMTSAVTPNAAAAPVAPAGKLTAKQFAQAVNALPASVRNSPNLHETPEYRALAARL